MKTILKSFIFLIVLNLISCMNNQLEKPQYQPKVGDILFQDLECGNLCMAIKEVTIGVDSSEFSHIGLVQKIGEKWMVLEAISDGVKYTPLLDFFSRSVDTNNNPKIWVGRLKQEYQPIINNLEVNHYLKQPYDDAFLMNNKKYYCSELLYEIFKDANGDKDFFELEPMTFKSLKTHEFLPVWIDYYNKIGIQIPESEPGINPAGISRSDKIEIVQKLGKVSKKKHQSN